MSSNRTYTDRDDKNSAKQIKTHARTDKQLSVDRGRTREHQLQKKSSKQHSQCALFVVLRVLTHFGENVLTVYHAVVLQITESEWLKLGVEWVWSEISLAVKLGTQLNYTAAPWVGLKWDQLSLKLNWNKLRHVECVTSEINCIVKLGIELNWTASHWIPSK